MLKVDFTTYNNGSGYFKLNNSLLLDDDYKVKVRRSISEIAAINVEANPSTLWEVIKGTVRNETIKYASFKKRLNQENEKQYIRDIQNLAKRLTNTNDQDEIDRLKTRLEQTKSDLDNITENELNGLIIRSKAQIVEQDEKYSKYFASLEKNRAESKIVSRLNVNGTIITEQKEVLTEQKQHYENLYKEKEQTNPSFNIFDEHDPKLNANEK